jgi:pilus assembly protein TadC
MRSERRIIALGKLMLGTKRREFYKGLLIRAGYKETPQRKLGFIVLFTFLVSMLWYVYILYTMGFSKLSLVFVAATVLPIIVGLEIVVLILTFVALRLYLNVRVESRMHKIEDNLPLFLREFSTNLKAGREFLDAFEDSLTPELGPLNEDLSEIVMELRIGQRTDEVLDEYISRYDSFIIREAFEIILESYGGGGGLADITEHMADNLDVIDHLKKEAIASVANYVIFIGIVSLLISPLLFALSFNLLRLLESLMKRVVIGSSQSFLPSFLSTLDIDFEDFKTFSRITIGLIAGSAAAIIGTIRKGTLRGSAVLIALFVLLSIAAYQIALFAIVGAFDILFGSLGV